MPLENTPVIIGAAQFVHRGPAADVPTPLEMLEIVANAAAGDAGLSSAALAGLNGVGVVDSALQAPGALRDLPVPRMSNPPAALAKALGASPRWTAVTETGGNSAQMLINVMAEQIAQGAIDFGVAVGAEYLGSVMKKVKSGGDFTGYGDEETEEPPRLGDARPGTSRYETLHGMGLPVNTYPMFENALRARDGRSLAAHDRRMGELFAPFTRVAAANPYAWFPVARSGEELVTVTPDNRMVSYPYPKYLNSILQVDQAAGVLICSVKKARELGVAPDKWVFLHGCADAHDLWFPLERQNFHSSPAIRLTGQRALEMAGIGVADIAAFDLYSCFPSAVEIGAEELGVAVDDPRGFTVTGGLPYAGGPGNNYSMHGVATMAGRLRAAPGTYGLCTGNGWYLTKQAIGVYSTAPFEGRWVRQDPHVIQRQIDALPHPEITETPDGAATVETYTVVHSRDGYRMGIVVGRDEAGRRFVANTSNDPAFLAAFESEEQVGRRGTVGRHDDGIHNLFTPN